MQLLLHPLRQNISCCSFCLLCRSQDFCLSQDVRKYVFDRFPRQFGFYTIKVTHKQFSLLDTIFSDIFYFGPVGKHLMIYKQIQNTYYMPAGLTGRHAVGFGDSSIDVAAEVPQQNIIKHCI